MDKTSDFRILVRAVDFNQYDALNVFEEELIKAWETLGVKVDILKYGGDKSYRDYILQNHYDAGFSINGGLFDETDTVIKKYFNMPIYTYYVDHPLWHDERIKRSREQHCIVFDSDHKGYVDRHYSLSHEADVVMEGGVEGANSTRPFTERKYPVVFCGTYPNCSAILQKIKEEKKEILELLYYMIDEGINHPDRTMEEIYNKVLDSIGCSFDDDKYTYLLSACDDAEACIRGYYREMVIKQLVDAGIPVEIYGSGNWEQLNCTRKDLLHCHPPVNYREMLDIYADAQIVINTSPWNKVEMNDRPVCGLLNGALVVSDETRYFREANLEEEKLILFSLKALQEVPSKVIYYLEHLDEAERIAQNGYKWAKENHTWGNRAEQFLELFKKYRNVNEI